MTRKIIFCLAVSVLFVAPAYAERTDLDSTWYCYLNSDQLPTVTDVKDYYDSFGYYPTLTGDQYQRIIHEPFVWEGFGLSAETQQPSAARGSSKKPS